MTQMFVAELVAEPLSQTLSGCVQFSGQNIHPSLGFGHLQFCCSAPSHSNADESKQS